MTDSPIRLVVDNAATRQRRRKAVGFSPWECRVCEVDTGTRTRALTKIRQYAEQGSDLSIKGGHDAWACAFCLARGKVTLVTA